MNRRQLLKSLALLSGGIAVGSLMERVKSASAQDRTRLSKYFRLPADVTVFRDGDYAVAVNNKGRVIARSDEHAEVMQTAIDTTGGKVYIKPGDYYIGRTITINRHGVVLEGETRGRGDITLRTRLIATASLSSLIQIGSSSSLVYDVYIRSLQLHGNNMVNNILDAYANGLVVEDTITWNAKNNGIYIRRIDGACETKLVRVVSANNGYNGIRIGTGDIHLTDVITGKNGEAGVLFFAETAVVQGLIENLHSYGNRYGLWVDSAINMMITNSYLEGNNKCGLWLRAYNFPVERVLIDNCVFWMNNQDESGWPHIQLSCEGCDIVDFIVRGCAFDPSADAVNYYIPQGTVQNGLITECIIRGPVKVPPNVKIKRCIGYATENSGIETITGDGTTTTFTIDVTHGLVSDSVVVRVTLDRPGSWRAWLVDTDADDFKETVRIEVTYDTAPASGESVPVYWEAVTVS